jgi:hypothetical protein
MKKKEKEEEVEEDKRNITDQTKLTYENTLKKMCASTQQALIFEQNMHCYMLNFRVKFNNPQYPCYPPHFHMKLMLNLLLKLILTREFWKNTSQAHLKMNVTIPSKSIGRSPMGVL